MDDPEFPRTERGFLRVLGYAWRKQLEEDGTLDDREASAGAELRDERAA